ncbi:tetratricopeptide repeat protein [Streptomyces sp. NPDC085481]|uniref:tetratricopeptide repeat protein n=1 Tax=Streptomyces sp. NPDC085481 TaxID=3365727 RepID=UPI0037D2B817
MPSHRDQELNVPDIDTVHTPFNRRLALSVAVIALFGSVLGYAACRAGTYEDEAARDAQRNAVLAMSEKSAALSEYYDRLGGLTIVAAFRQRRAIAEARAELLSMPGESTRADHWEEASGEVADLSPLPQQEPSLQNAPLSWADAAARPVLAQLHQQTSRRMAAEWGDKASLYVGGITLLAIALALLGLSATITPRIRPFFWWPAAAISVATLVGFLIVVLTPVPHISERAMKAVAEGDRLLLRGEPGKAMASYTSAVRDSGQYGVGFQKRADARAAAENPGSRYVFNVMSPRARRENVADLDRAIQLGEETFANLANQGANYFHLKDYEKMEEFTRRAIAMNDALPIPRLNLALAMAARGRTEQAQREFRRSIKLFQKRSLLERSELYASARTQLEILLAQQPERIEAVRRLQGMLVKSEAEARVPGRHVPADRASIQALDLNLDGPHINVGMTYTNILPNSLVSKIFYFRKGPGDPWVQRHDLNTFEPFADLPRQGPAVWTGLVEFQCPSAGEYRVDVYVDDRMLESAEKVRESRSGDLRTHYDPLGRYTLCQPSTWRYSTKGAGHGRFESPDGEQRLSLQSVPVALPMPMKETTIETALTSLRNRIRTEPALTEDVQDKEIGGVKGTGRTYELADGRKVDTWAALTADGMLHTFMAEYRAGRDDQMMKDLEDRVKYLDQG